MAVSAETAEGGSVRLRRVSGIRFFSSSPDAPRVRRPTDVTLLVLCTLVLVALGFAAPGPTGLDAAISSLITEFPGFASWMWDVCYAALVVWAVLLMLVALLRRGRRRLLGDYVLAAVVALGIALLASKLSGSTVSQAWHSLFEASPPSVYLAVRLALCTAVVVAASPHVARPFRWIGRLVIVFGATAAVIVGVALPIGAFAGFIVGVAAGAVVHLALGSPGGRPTPDQVADALTDLDLDVVDVSDAVVQVPGVALFTADTPDRGELLVKVYGRDAWDAQVIGSTWTAMRRRGERPHLGSGRLQRVEHEAVVTLLAERAGVPVLPVVSVGTSADGDALIVSEVTGRPLSTLGGEAVTDDLLRRTWQSLTALHRLGLAHGRIDRDHLVLRTDGSVAFGDFAEATVAADRGDLMSDRARLLVATAVATDATRAVAAAESVIGPEGIAELLPYLQPAVLDRATRRAIAGGDWKLDDLVAAALAASGGEMPKLERIQRVTWKSLALIVLIGGLTYWLISKLLGVDFQAIFAELADANVALLAAALLLSPTIQMGLAFSTMGATTAKLRYVPVLLLQYAIQFIALTLPSTAARLALEVRFFERFGIAPGAALSMGVIDSVSGFVVQVLLILLIVLSGLPGLTGQPSDSSTSSSSTDTTTDSGPSVLMILLALLLFSLVVALIVPALRHRLFTVIPRARAAVVEQMGEVRGALVVLRRPRKVGTMLGGNLVAQMLQALVLGVCLAAFGETAHFSQLVLINTAVSLFAGLMPVPGGMGVAEAGYTAGLQAIGIPSAIAVSTAIAYRLATFYLPPLWGAFSMRWLHRRSYV